METMIERVAEAICDSLEADVFDELEPNGITRAAYIQQAQWAIKAMREPTPQMESAANDAFPDAPNETTCRKLGCDIYKAMIDAALAEQK